MNVGYRAHRNQSNCGRKNLGSVEWDGQESEEGSLAADRSHHLRRSQRCPPRGYIEMHLTDSSYVYGVKGPGLDAFVTLVNVTRDGTDWNVTSWQATGC